RFLRKRPMVAKEELNMNSRYSVVIVDDDPLVRRALSGMLAMHPQLEVVGLAANGREAVKLVESLKPDLVLVDIHMPEVSGIEAVAPMKAVADSKIVILTVDDDEDIILKAIGSGADGFLAKDCDPATLIEGLLKVLKGVPVIYPGLSDGLLFKVLQNRSATPSTDQTQLLTQRETEVLRLLTKGMSNREIAENLSISIQTVKSHVSSILEKLGARDRTQAAVIALSNDLIR
ncbi:MAG: response regulator, partial [Bacillota bacterium]